MSHLGRPKGKDESFSLKHIIDKVEDVLGLEVLFIDDCIGPDVEKAANSLLPGQVLLLENLRFYKEEKEGNIQSIRHDVHLTTVLP